MALLPLSHWARRLKMRHRAPQCKMPWGIVATLIFGVFFGCEGRQSAAQRLEEAYKSAGMDPVAVYPLNGTITVDGERPVAKSETTRSW